jgi:hypothetical protein
MCGLILEVQAASNSWSNCYDRRYRAPLRPASSRAQKVSAACDERQRVGAEVVVCDAELSDAATLADNFDLRDPKVEWLAHSA